jgi:hypothetical protein
VGQDASATHFQVLKLDRSHPQELSVVQDAVVYNADELSELMDRIAMGNRSTGGLTKKLKAYGLLGMVYMHAYMV